MITRQRVDKAQSAYVKAYWTNNPENQSLEQQKYMVNKQGVQLISNVEKFQVTTLKLSVRTAYVLKSSSIDNFQQTTK